MRKVVYLGPVDGCEIVAQALGSAFHVLRVDATAEAVLAAVGDAEVILDASMKVRLAAALLDSSPHLKLVITATTGSDHIDGERLAARRIPLMTLRGQEHVTQQLTPAAELTWLLLLACARKLRPAIHHVEEGRWNRELFPGAMLKGRTLGLVGLGRIGKWVARYANAFDMRVLAFDPYNQQWPPEIESVDLARLMRESDFISIHVHLTPETRGLLGAPEFALVRPGTILINTARGAVVDESALLEALHDGRIAAFGCDVLEGEPDVTNSRLWQYAMRNTSCVITPHIGGFSPDALTIVLRHTAKRIAEFFHG